MEIKESLCKSCGDLCRDEVDCRVWIYNGNEYTVPPKTMIVDAILREVYGGSNSSGIDENEERKYQLPENLKRFFHAMREKDKK